MNRPDVTHGKCDWFLEELEGLTGNGPGATAEDWLRKLPKDPQEHVGQCESCRAALEDFAETRAALEGFRAGMPQPGPWFTAGVMAGLRAKEEEIEETKERVWFDVRRQAPRLAAFAAVLLVVGGTWAIQVRRTTPVQGTAMRQVEGLFESGPSVPANDEVMVSATEEQLP